MTCSMLLGCEPLARSTLMRFGLRPPGRCLVDHSRGRRPRCGPGTESKGPSLRRRFPPHGRERGPTPHICRRASRPRRLPHRSSELRRTDHAVHRHPSSPAARLPAAGSAGRRHQGPAEPMTTAARAPLGALASRIVRLHEMLDSLGVPHQFGGAIALAWYRNPRATTDIDVNLTLPPEAATPMLGALASLGVTVSPSDREVIARDGQARLDWDGSYLDVFFATLEFHREMARTGPQGPLRPGRDPDPLPRVPGRVQGRLRPAQGLARHRGDDRMGHRGRGATRRWAGWRSFWATIRRSTGAWPRCSQRDTAALTPSN